MTNIKRAETARACIDLFTSLTGVDTTEDAIGDLIANLGHFAQAKALDFLPLVQTGIGHWFVEQTDEDCIDALPRVEIAIDGQVS